MCAFKMYVVVLLFLFATLSTVDSVEKWSLNYIYTALSKPVELPGIHEFTAMGLMNDKQIDCYDSVAKKKIPKQDWMREKMPADYWDKGTQSRKSKEQWFKVNINILMDRMRHNNTDVHILQWKHGCEIDRQSDGTLKFIKGTDQYSYDGDDFLAFDDANMQWVAPVVQAQPTKRKWDGVQILNQYTKGYLEKECVDWLSKFMAYEAKEFSRADSPPMVYAFAKKAKTAGHVRLTCMATDFYPKDVIMQMKKNGVPLTEHDGVQSTGVLPNNDDTYQIRMSVQIPAADKETYECSVNHVALKEPVVVKWDGKCCDCTQVTGVIIGAVVVLVLLLTMVSSMLVLWKKGKIFAGKKGDLPATGIQAPLNGNGNGAAVLNMPVIKDDAISTDSGTKDGASSTDSGQGSNECLEREALLANGGTKDGASSTDSGQGSNERLEREAMLANGGTKDGASSTDSGQGSNERLEREAMLANGGTKDGASSTDSGQGSNERLEREAMLANGVIKDDAISTDSGQGSNESLEERQC
ncbi:major histocompatibility complex class I-related gene protein isoform X6 [Oncorhynchus mykiss]|uniref:major histocompatibility complex class I-related gene protein isoform X4 n=1 Tax=Oncorhynchus mykiss TaxID=8022 RepID=UPI001877D024|nr:major histocompatibility complex class I-related gene protein isoform X4 [Oncorhynchus mykiss]XP_036808709.1 major histocompatibility complex class I-related gene protein isoform X5 [Oncorhynchus mykiss]XP_036808710.1 major histocompatibility complex class I-related gene protein isoform X6 [Oncorhynchus mykiss]